jgi:hypothetical protein
MSELFKKETIIYYLLSLYFLIGVIIFKDFGIGIEEHFQRSSGFYWLNYLLQFTELENLKNLVNNKIYEIKSFHPNLPPVDIAKHYGIVFDLPMALIEVIFNIDDNQTQFYLRHFSNFIIFLVSGYFFYLIILKRTKIYSISIISCLFYLLSPRIFGNSFFDGKDLFFLSLITINFFLFISYIEKRSLSTILLFSLFCALSTSSRVMGLFFPIGFIILSIFQIINNKEYKKIICELFLFIFLFFIFLYIHWPYLWTLQISELVNFFQSFKVAANPIVYFNGNYYISEYLPQTYLPLWIAISTPEIIILTFVIGIIFFITRLLNRFANIKPVMLSNDLWRGKEEKTDFFIFLGLFQIIIVYISFSLNLYGGWRHFLFLHFFIIYFSAIGIHFVLLRFKNNLNLKRYFVIILSFFIFEIIFNLYKYHPFQSVYFNNLVSSGMKKNFEVDTQSLSRVEAIKDILRDSEKTNNITIGTASWTPLENGRSLIKKNYWYKLNFTGTSNKEKVDYIYTNYYYEVNPLFAKKYKIPENFKLFKTLTIDNTHIYSIYKKNHP